MTVTDCFKNEIKVKDLQEAIQQTERFVNWCGDDAGYIFPRFKLVDSVDQFGRSIKISKQTNCGKYVRQRLYWKHLLTQLQKQQQA